MDDQIPAIDESVPDAMSQAAFARHLGRSKSWVTRLKQAGRLVLLPDGRLDVDGSLRRIEATAGTRHDLADRNAEERDGRQQSPADTTEGAGASTGEGGDDILDLDEIGRRTRIAKMLAAEADARSRTSAADELSGLQIRRASVLKDMTDATGVILSTMDSLPDRVAPLLVNIADQSQIRGVLRDEVGQMQSAIAEQLAEIAR